MSQTLIVHNDKAMIDLLNLNLPIYVGTDVIVKNSFKEAQVLIEHHPGIHLIVCADVSGEEATAVSIFRFNIGLNKIVPLIVMGEKSKLPSSPHVTVLSKDPNLKLILQAAAKYLKVTPKKMNEAVVPDFFPIGINFFLSVIKAPCAIYVENGDKYIKKFSEGETLNSDDVKNLITSGIKTLYVDAPNRLKLVNNITNELVNRLTNVKMTMEEKLTATDEAIQAVQEEAISGGSPASAIAQELTNKAISTCMEIAKSNPSVAGLLKKLLSSKTSYLYKHIQLIITITQHIIACAEWGSNEQKEKLAFVAFFHDICLTDDKLAKFSSDFAVNADVNLTKSEKEIIFKHAKTSAELVQKFPNAPLGADIIIMQHHGTVSGQGFAKAFTNSISPLAIVFIVAEEMAHLILEVKKPEEIPSKKTEILEKLNSKFNRSNYQKIIACLDTLTF